jgi:hypothetical protein
MLTGESSQHEWLAFSDIGGAQAEEESEYTARRAQNEEQDAAVDPEGSQQVGVGPEALRRLHQANADLHAPAESNDGRYE